MARVLVADDDPTVLRMVAEFLTACGHEVIRATHGGEAREVFDRGGVEVLVSDLEMPVMNGIELLAHVRSSTHPIPVIMASGTWAHGQRGQARDLGAARTYSKPVDLAQVVRDIEELLRA
ncbi:MAG: response regulator [Planctomycetota bacterium]